MTEPESRTLADLRRLDEKFDLLRGEVGEQFDRIEARLEWVEGRLERVDGRLGRIEEEFLVLNGIALRLEGREVETTGLKAILATGMSADLPTWDAASPSWKVPRKGSRGHEPGPFATWLPPLYGPEKGAVTIASCDGSPSLPAPARHGRRDSHGRMDPPNY